MASPLPTATHLVLQRDAEREETWEMSAEELKAHLYHSLQAKGILDQLKVGQNASIASAAFSK